MLRALPLEAQLRSFHSVTLGMARQVDFLSGESLLAVTAGFPKLFPLLPVTHALARQVGSLSGESLLLVTALLLVLLYRYFPLRILVTALLLVLQRASSATSSCRTPTHTHELPPTNYRPRTNTVSCGQCASSATSLSGW